MTNSFSIFFIFKTSWLIVYFSSCSFAISRRLPNVFNFILTQFDNPPDFDVKVGRLYKVIQMH